MPEPELVSAHEIATVLPEVSVPATDRFATRRQARPKW